jgi:hypothetical protein
MTLYLTRPGHHKRGLLTLRNFHTFLNNRPVEATKKLKYIFINLYKDFKIPDQTIAIVFMNIEAQEQVYDLKLQADIRKFFFNP